MCAVASRTIIIYYLGIGAEEAVLQKVLCGNFLDGKFHLDGTLERSFFRVASLSV